MSPAVKIFAAIGWLLALVGAFELGARTGSGARSWGSSGSLEDAVAIRHPIHRSFAISRSLRTLDTARLPETVRTVEDARFWFTEQDHYLLMDAWVPIAPDAATDWALARPRPLDRRAKAALADALGFHNPARATALIRSLGLSDEAEALHEHMVQGWARSEAHDSLASYIERLDPGRPRQRAIEALISEILKRGPDALIAWADAIPLDAERQWKRITFRKSVGAMARVDAPRTALWLDLHLGRRYAANSVKILALTWIQSDPAAAMDWLATLDEEYATKKLVKRCFSGWATRDKRAAEAWALDAPWTSTLDPVFRVVVRRHFDRDPAQAMRWAHRIRDRDTRLRILASTGRAWWRADPDAFMAWLPESGLDEQVRDVILNAARKDADPDRREGAVGRTP